MTNGTVEYLRAPVASEDWVRALWVVLRRWAVDFEVSAEELAAAPEAVRINVLRNEEDGSLTLTTGVEE